MAPDGREGLTLVLPLFCYLMLGVTLALIATRVLATAAPGLDRTRARLAALTIGGHVYGASQFYTSPRNPPTTAMAMQTAVGFAVALVMLQGASWAHGCRMMAVWSSSRLRGLRLSAGRAAMRTGVSI